jgi:hypothetical protein
LSSPIELYDAAQTSPAPPEKEGIFKHKIVTGLPLRKGILISGYLGFYY